jgi:hypothetical protein
MMSGSRETNAGHKGLGTAKSEAIAVRWFVQSNQMPTRIVGNSRNVLGVQGVRTWSPISDQIDQMKMKGSIMCYS